MKRKRFGTSVFRRLSWAATLVFMVVGVADAQIVFEEYFNSLVLGPSVNERVVQSRVTVSQSDPLFATTSSVPNAFSHTGPAGWTVDNNFNVFGFGTSDGAPGVPEQGNPDYGVDEWEGWSFANKTFWIQSDDQGRSSFTNGVGTVAVVDSDEYDDIKNVPNFRAGYIWILVCRRAISTFPHLAGRRST